MTAVDHIYAYAGQSAVDSRGDRGGRALQLVTSGGAEPHPYFFEGELTHPRLTAQALRALSRLVGTRFFTPPAMLNRILLAADPVITSGRGALRFEGFSACASAYARVDLSDEAYAGDVTGFGTTNVDFNAAMRAALASVRDGEPLGFAVGQSEVVLRRVRGDIVERRVALPTRWLKGFVEVQSYLSRMQHFAELSGVEALRFLRALPRAKSGRTPAFLMPVAGATGGSLRIGATSTSDSVPVAGLERLRVLEDLAPMASRLRVHSDPQGEATAWELQLGVLRFTLVLSAETWRGFSGEGQALGALVRKRSRTDAIARVRAQLQWQSELDVTELAGRLELSREYVGEVLQLLGSRGLVGFDQHAGTYFHRELPFDLSRVEALAPRLTAARALVAAGAVSLADVEARRYFVESNDVKYQVLVSVEGDPVQCTCPWHAKHRGARGPCKHQLAVRLFVETSEGTDG